MGMMTYFVSENIEVKDWEGLKKFMELWEKLYPDWDRIMSKKAMIKKTKWDETKGEDGKEEREYFTFEEWNELKLISYWYDDEIIFLTCIAKYIEGEVEFEFESKDEAGSIRFEEGKCIITTGQMNWNEWKAEEELRDKKAIPPEIKKLLILNSLEN